MTKNILKLNNQDFLIHTLDDIKSNMVIKLAKVMTHWQTDNEFNQFLKEKPTDVENNKIDIERKILEDQSIMKVLRDITGEIIGVLSLNSFDKNNLGLELSLKISPNFQGQGIGTAFKKNIMKEIFDNGHIKEITSWHSCLNKGTFFTNKKCGGVIVDFKENNTFLPNKKIMTDDFKWKITKDSKFEEKNFSEIIGGNNFLDVIKGLEKHMKFNLKKDLECID